MSVPPNGDISVGELARQLRDVFTRIEGLARRLEDQFVSNKVLDLYRENVNQALAALEKNQRAHEQDKAEKSALTALETRVTSLEDDKKWLVRLVIGFIILGLLGVLFAASGATPK